MKDHILLSVRNPDTGEDYVADCKLPVRLGKHPDSGNQVLFDPKYRGISRVHGTISRDERGLLYADSSSNGSRVNGLVVRNGKVALAERFEIEIGEYVIMAARFDPLIILSTDQSLLELQRHALLPGRGVGIVRRSSSFALADLNRWTESDKPIVARFEIVADQSMVVIENDAERSGARLNKSPLTKLRTVVTPLDVVEIGAYRFEVLDRHQRSIVCRHDTCHLLNKPPYEQDCRWCGRHLANTGAMSRVL